MNKELELKKAIINWLFDNENQWQRVNACCEEFKAYIYDNKGNYLIGGKNVSNFISEADRFIWK